MRHQSLEAGQEEEDKARDQNPTEPIGGPECCCPIGCGEGQSEQDAIIDL